MDEPYESDNFVSEEVGCLNPKERPTKRARKDSRSDSVKKGQNERSKSKSRVTAQKSRPKGGKTPQLMDEGLEYVSIPKPKGRLTETDETVQDNELDCMDLELDDLDRKYVYCDEARDEGDGVEPGRG